MNMGLDIADLRMQAESMMTDQCAVSRIGTPVGTPVLDPVTGEYPPNPAVAFYVGKCSIRVPGTVSTGKVRPSAGDSASLLNAILAIPVDSPALTVTDTVIITASEFNPALVGMEFTISSLLPASWVTKQRAALSAVID